MAEWIGLLNVNSIDRIGLVLKILILNGDQNIIKTRINKKIMYTEQELKDAIRCAVCISLKLYPSKEELEEDIASLANDRVRNIIIATVAAGKMLSILKKN